jgi:hypothetical protein
MPTCPPNSSVAGTVPAVDAARDVLFLIQPDWADDDRVAAVEAEQDVPQIGDAIGATDARRFTGTRVPLPPSQTRDRSPTHERPGLRQRARAVARSMRSSTAGRSKKASTIFRLTVKAISVSSLLRLLGEPALGLRPEQLPGERRPARRRPQVRMELVGRERSGGAWDSAGVRTALPAAAPCDSSALLGHAVGHPDQLPERVGTGADADDAGELVAESPEVAIAVASCRSISRDTSAIFVAIAWANAGERTFVATSSACAASTS